jgi:hypothetical protein
MDNLIPSFSKAQKKQKNKGFAKPAQNAQPKPQAAVDATPQVQGQQAQQSKPQAA